MKMLKSLLIITITGIAPSIYAMMQSSTPSQKKTLSMFDNPAVKFKDPKFSLEKATSKPVKTTNSITDGILLNTIYGPTGRNPQYAFADFEDAHAMSKQSNRIGAPLPVGVFYTMPKRQKDATKIIYNGLEKSGSKTQFSVSPEQWRIIGSDMPLIVRVSLPNVTVGLERSSYKKCNHVIAHTFQGCSIGCAIGTTISLANNGSKSTKKEIIQLRRENKTKAFEHCISAVAKNLPKAIDAGLEHASNNLNNLDINPVDRHCDQTYSYEQGFFTDATKKVSSVLADEAIAAAIHYGKSLIKEELSSSSYNIITGAIQPEDVLAGGAIGGTIGLVYGLYTMNNPIQKDLLPRIYCARV